MTQERIKIEVNAAYNDYQLSIDNYFTEKENLARKKYAVIGSKVASELKTFSRNLLNKDVLIGGATYKIIGILKEEGASGWQSPDDELYIPILTATSRIAGTEDLGWINVGIPNDANVDYVMMSIEEVLRRQHDIGPGENNDFRINDWSQYSDLRRQATSIFTALIQYPTLAKDKAFEAIHNNEKFLFLLEVQNKYIDNPEINPSIVFEQIQSEQIKRLFGEALMSEIDLTEENALSMLQDCLHSFVKNQKDREQMLKDKYNSQSISASERRELQKLILMKNQLDTDDKALLTELSSKKN